MNEQIRKDKSRRNLEANQFQMSSQLFYIHPKYDFGAKNFDICLIKTPTDEFGIHYDLSSNFEFIPCLPDVINLQEVITSINFEYLLRYLQEHGKACWVAGWGQTQSNGVFSDSLKAVGINLFSHNYCLDHRYLKQGCGMVWICSFMVR